MSKYLSEGLGWLKRSLSEHENVAAANDSAEQGASASQSGASSKRGPLPQQRSLDLPSAGNRLHVPQEDDNEVDEVDGNAQGKSGRSVSVGAMPAYKEEEEETSFELEVNGESNILTFEEMT